VTLSCRSCGSTALKSVIDLGVTPLANGLLDPADAGRPEPRFPLKVVFCEDCALVQITETVPPADLFSAYVYFSSFSDTAVASARAIAERLVAEKRLGARSRVIEIASNDGYLLRHYRDLGVPVLGVEPAANIAAHAAAAGIPTRTAFFGRDEAIRMAAEGLKADVIHANNVLAHVPDLNGFVAGIATILNPDGVASIEFPYLRDLIEHMEFDTIYHEHVFYFSALALVPVLERHGLMPVDVERIPIHGGSLRLFVGHAGQPTRPSVAALLADERRIGLDRHAHFASFASRVDRLREELTRLLARLKSEGRSIAAYGASAKGATLLNTFGIGGDTLAFVADRSSVKQGKLTPGTHLPIVPPEAVLEQRPDYLLLLTWNFAEEILKQLSEYRARGGKVIIPLPTLRIV
jgi:SAM-dependent methyltransferase